MAALKLLLLTAVICIWNRRVLGEPLPPDLPPPPPKPSPTPSQTPQNAPPPPLVPIPLQPNQCSFGVEDARISATGHYAEPNSLYLLANDPATCSGFINNLEICYLVTGSLSSSDDFHIFAFRPQFLNGAVRSYRKVDGTSVVLQPGNLEGAEAECQYVQPEEVLWLREGDVLGFITGEGVVTLLTTSNERDLYLYTPSGTKQKRGKRLSAQDVFSMQSIANSELERANETVTPLLKIVMNSSLVSSQVIPTPTKKPNPQPCPGDRKNSQEKISTFVFTSVIISSAVVIFALLMMVCILCCCLCGICANCSCKFCKICKCCLKIRHFCCQRRGKRAEKVSGVLDQSMQYNETYLPTDPNMIITGGLKQPAKLHENPAYGQQKLQHHSSGRRGLEHTYESIENLNIS